MTRLFKQLFFAVAATMFIALPAMALELQEAKEKGLVGEMANGYLGSPQASPSAEVAALIEDINTKRKEKYREIATAQNIPLVAVEKLAGEKAFAKTESGHYINLPGGGWRKK